MKLYFLLFLFVMSSNVSAQQVYSDGVLKSEGGMNHNGHKSKYWKHYKNGLIESEGWYVDGLSLVSQIVLDFEVDKKILHFYEHII